MVILGARGRIALLVATALVVGILGPCLCGPTAAAANPSASSHGCCGGELVLVPASLDCCPGCAARPTLEPGLVRAGAPGVAPPATARVAALVLGPSAASLLAPLRSFVVPAPPTILRV